MSKKTIFVVITAFLLSLHLFVSTTLASGVNAATGTGAGQLRVAQDGDARYLTTTTNGTGSAQARTATGSAFYGFGFNARNLPLGFFTDPENLITDAINIVFIVAILLAFFYLIWAGFDWITSGGDKGKIDGARQKIINVVVGLILVAASYAILTLILQVLGYNSLEEVLRETQTRVDN